MQIFASPSRTADPTFSCGCTVSRDQVLAVIGAITALHEYAALGVAVGTNRALRRLRLWIIDAATTELALDPDEIAKSVAVTALVSEESLRSKVDDPDLFSVDAGTGEVYTPDSTPSGGQVTIFDRPEPLREFPHWQDDRGAWAIVRRNESARRIKEGFVARSRDGFDEIFERKVINGHRAGRLPLQLEFGESVAHLFRTLPGLSGELKDVAQRFLIESISDARNDIRDRLTDIHAYRYDGALDPSMADFEAELQPSAEDSFQIQSTPGREINAAISAGGAIVSAFQTFAFS